MAKYTEDTCRIVKVRHGNDSWYEVHVKGWFGWKAYKEYEQYGGTMRFDENKAHELYDQLVSSIRYERIR